MPFYSIITMSSCMDFDRVLGKRKMIRRYKQDKQVPEELIEKLIENAHRAPSAGHTQVQEFVIIKDPNVKKKLAEAALNQNYIADAPVSIVVCSNTSRSEARYGRRGREFYSIIDGAFASMIILLTATNEKLGAGFVAAFEDQKVSELLGLPEYARPIGIIALGYPDERPEKLKRIERDRLVHYDGW
jgi:nitroreductase